MFRSCRGRNGAVSDSEGDRAALTSDLIPEDVALVVHVAPVIAVLVLGHLPIVGVVTSASLVRASDGGDGDRVEKRGGGDHRRRRYRRRRRWYGGGGCGGRGRRGGAGAPIAVPFKHQTMLISIQMSCIQPVN